MSIIDHSSNRILPLEAAIIEKAAAIERMMMDGKTVSYEAVEEIDDMRWDDIRRRHNVTEVPGDGYRIARTATVREGSQFIGRFATDTAPNDFIHNLVSEAIENGEATATDVEGCTVTAVAD